MNRLLPLVALSLLAPVDASPFQEPSKIDGLIFAHQRQKARPAGRSVEEHRAILEDLRLDADDLFREEVTLVLEREFTPEEVIELGGVGIEIHASTWIPPVPGHHPHGVVIADVPYVRMGQLAGDERILSVRSAERRGVFNNFTGAQMIGVDHIHAGDFTKVRKGDGIKIAIADSGLEVGHGDIPTPVEQYDVTDGVGLANWGTNVRNFVSGHGTHVTGTAVGSGALSSGVWTGMAPNADLYFYKIGNNTSGTTSISDQIEAVNRAVAVGVDIFNMSVGNMTDYMDGSSSICQAIDAAHAAGVFCTISAGNARQLDLHDKATLAPGQSYPPTGNANFLRILYDNSGSSSAAQPFCIRLIWEDDDANYEGDIVLSGINFGANESIGLIDSGVSSRGTEMKLYEIDPDIAAGGSGNFTLRLNNNGTDSPEVHLFSLEGRAKWETPDQFNTVEAPALADDAVAVGAWIQADAWVNYKGDGYLTSETTGTLGTFSAYGPRIDGKRKPNLVAPGSATISALDHDVSHPESDIIDNDLTNMNGSGPADYVVSHGTSMAAPVVAGVAALLLQENPTLSPDDLLDAFKRTSSRANNPNNKEGWGLIDALDAINDLEVQGVWIDFAHTPTNPSFPQGRGSYADPYINATLADQLSPAGIRFRYFPGSSPAAAQFAIPRDHFAEDGTVTLGQ